MKTQSKTRTRAGKRNLTPAEDDFAALDAWAKNLRLEDGRPLTATEQREEKLSRSVGRPPKPEAAKAKRCMISMTPTLIEAANAYAKRTGHTLSGLIAESLAEKIKRSSA